MIRLIAVDEYVFAGKFRVDNCLLSGFPQCRASVEAVDHDTMIMRQLSRLWQWPSLPDQYDVSDSSIQMAKSVQKNTLSRRDGALGLIVLRERA